VHDETKRLLLMGRNLQKVLKEARFMAKHDDNFIENIRGEK